MKFFIAALLLTVLFRKSLGVLNGYPVLKLSQVEEMSADIDQLIQNTEEDGMKILVPGLIRLAFHECVDVCDGCVNFAQKENRGLQRSADYLETIYTKYNETISRADFWALAAKVAVAAGVRQNNEVFCEGPGFSDPDCKMPEMIITFRYGRPDCKTSPNTDFVAELPNAFWDHDRVLEWFKTHFRMTGNNAVAMLGAHTVGRAQGMFNGSWEAENPDGMNTNYYKRLLNDKTWAQKDISSETEEEPLYGWRTSDGKGFALNVDIALVKEINITDPDNGKSSCGFSDCKRPGGTAGMLARYAGSKATWVQHFTRLYSRILEQGHHMYTPAEDDKERTFSSLEEPTEG